MHTNSLAAYYAGHLEAFSDREQAILRAFEWLGIGTDRECKDRLKLSDMNDVRPRITELIRKGVLEECGTCECNVTHQQVRKVKIARRASPTLVPAGPPIVKQAVLDL